MCVHWTHFQEENFETPAISFKLQVPNSFEIINKSFVLLDTINKTYYRLKTLKLIEKDTINSLGLSLDSKYMQQYFKTEINVTDNCFTSDLKALSKRSNILLITQGDTSIIPRTLNHNFYEGQKVKFQQ